MCTLDERILEHLADDSWSTLRHISRTINLTASRGQVEERCQLHSQVGLVAPIFENSNMYEITYEGQEYLAGNSTLRIDSTRHLNSVDFQMSKETSHIIVVLVHHED